MATGKPSQGLRAKIALLFGEAPRSTRPSEPASEPVTDEEDAAARKDLAKRKLRDDTIRRREFDHLRPLVRKKLNAEHPGGFSGATRPSVFRASTGMDERAETLKKIEFIEAHVVQSWGAMRTAQKAAVKPLATAPPPATRHSAIVTLTEIVPPSLHAPLEYDMDMDLDFTQLPATALQAAEVPAHTEEREDADAPMASALHGTASERDDSGLSPVESDLRDAAILFSDGDIDATVTQLLSPLELGGLAPDLTDALVSALCDVYRYSGQQEKFMATAMDHAAQFGRSPPEWFSLPEILSRRTKFHADAQPSSEAGKHAAYWACPAELQVSDLTALETGSADASTELHLDWSALQHVHAGAAVPLASLLARWCKQTGTMHWSAHQHLLAALQLHTGPQSDAASAPWWRSHLDALRILGLQEDFENLAMEYCTVFEVSPPSWEPARCRLAQGNDKVNVQPASAAHQLPASDSANLVRAQHHNFALIGDQVGEYSPQLEALAGACALTEHVCVDCRHIGRVDFSAAGSILNLVLQSKVSGSTLQFVQVPHLVAVFFKMLGIDRHAQVMTRTH